MQTWTYSELVLQTPSIHYQTFPYSQITGNLLFTVIGDASGMKKYNPHQLEETIAALGVQGWEMVTMTETLLPNGWLRTRWVFKRPGNTDQVNP